MSSIAEFRLPQAVFYGRGSFAKVGEQASLRGRKTLLLSDRNMERAGYVERCREHLEQSGVAHVSYLDVNTEPTDNMSPSPWNCFCRNDVMSS
ncbi:hypothetical protein BSNK01_16330 [Bacillaceae bacterium]